jgi:hypothetical protein
MSPCLALYRTTIEEEVPKRRRRIEGTKRVFRSQQEEPA